MKPDLDLIRQMLIALEDAPSGWAPSARAGPMPARYPVFLPPGGGAAARTTPPSGVTGPP